jgi:hypothetical protein
VRLGVADRVRLRLGVVDRDRDRGGIVGVLVIDGLGDAVWDWLEVLVIEELDVYVRSTS